MKKIKNIFSAIILLITFILVIVLVFAKINGESPEFFGYRLLRISSPSMEPELKTGDIILSYRVDEILTVKNGDIITYNGEVGEYTGKMITHQVTTAPYLSNGKYYLQTKGIANSSPDPEISENQVVGKMVTRLSLLTAVYSFFATPWGLFVILGFLAVLFVNEVFALRQLVKENDDEETDRENSSSQPCPDEKSDGE